MDENLEKMKERISISIKTLAKDIIMVRLYVIMRKNLLFILEEIVYITVLEEGRY